MSKQAAASYLHHLCHGGYFTQCTCPREQEVRSQEQVRSGEVGRISEELHLPASQRAFVSSQHFQVSKLLSESLSWLSRKDILGSRCEGGRDQGYAYSISVSPSPVSPEANLSAVSFTCHLPGVETCKGWWGHGREREGQLFSDRSNPSAR